ncbi:hypothetical protein scyTo_0023736 [Scyliorhinus torazame]|uniref:K Homology domain-containing protein n=1 Tax=Scyliorhinus torazame TaxID=75743 RepID=A0A401QD16_SCYTO|nr:hypothetical protein [Scyliorhinus torazame]
MGLKGGKVQQITRDHDVQIKFPERDENQGPDLHPQENGDLNPDLREGEQAPRKCDVIVVSGRKEKCEAAREALLVGRQASLQRFGRRRRSPQAPWLRICPGQESGSSGIVGDPLCPFNAVPRFPGHNRT